MISFRSKRGKERREGDKEAITSIINKDMVIVGDLSFNGKTMLDGRVEGNVRGEYLIISESGNVVGDIEASEVVILEGNSTVIGDVTTKKLIIEEGAVFNGTCHMGSETSGKMTRRENASGDQTGLQIPTASSSETV